MDLLENEDLGTELPDFFKKPKSTHLQFFLLMMLHEQPTHGYDIIKKIEKRTFGEWRPSHSAIYNLLGTLEEKGFIKIDKSGERDKKIYKLTEKGNKLVEVFRQGGKRFFRSLIQTIFTDKDFEIPPMAIRMVLEDPGKDLLTDYSNEKQNEILTRFKETLEDMIKKVDMRLNALKK